ncbi:MAG: hypothetical protein JST46_13215 [Bacteroidetes bacterium]|nr:hypothetical protein [Bacteroidota bacterium]
MGQGPALNASFGADITDLRNKISQAKGMLGDFKEGFMELAKTAGLAFGVREVANFTIEITKLAGQADGVRQAFNKLADSASVLSSLKEATRGTVSELDLMKSAVQASNFRIPVEQLGQLFQFAYERAKATGQSVDYLVNSIVTGIGRKSPLILDNLGISAVALKEKLGGVSAEAASIADVTKAVGEIASEELQKMGTSATTTAEQIASIGASWENIKEKAGSAIAPFMSELLTNLNNQLTVWSDKSIPLWKKILGNDEDYADWVKAAQLKANNTPMGPNVPQLPNWGSILGPNKNKNKQPSLPGQVDKKKNQGFQMGDELPTIESLIKVNPDVAENSKKAIEMVGQSLENLAKVSIETANDAWDKQIESMMKIAPLSASIADNITRAATGQISFAQAMANTTKQIIQFLAQQAIMNVIKGTSETFGWLGPAAIPIIAGAAGMLEALIDKVVPNAGASAAGASAAINTRYVSSSALNGNLQSAPPQIVGVVSGSQLNLIMTNYNLQGSYLRPGG